MEPGSLMTSELPSAPWTPPTEAIHVILKIVQILLQEYYENINIVIIKYYYILFCLHIIVHVYGPLFKPPLF